VSKIRIEDDGSYLSVNEEGQETRLEKAKITLNDCLACSGCIFISEYFFSKERKFVNQSKTFISEHSNGQHQSIVA
jgi:iron only hydrogenase large subunit-like protein